MAEKKYPYSVSGDFPNQKVNSDSLTSEINASSIATALDYITVNGDECDIWFVDELSPADVTTLNGVVAAHQGNPPYRFAFKASSKVVGDAKSVTSPTEWEDVGGAVTNITFFIDDVSKAWGRFSGQIKTVGAGAKLRVIREDDGLVCTPADITLPDTEDAWLIVSFWANQNQPAIPDRFILQAYLNGATSLEVRDYAVSLMELLT